VRWGWLLALALMGCAPTWDWRELPLASGAVTARFACKPVSQMRELPWLDAGKPLPTTLWACEHGGVTQAVVLADVGDPARVGLTLRAWREATLANLAAQGPSERGAWAVPRATPQPEAGRWAFTGRRSDGAALHVQTALASRGTWVIQATLVGAEALPPAVAQAFFEGVAFGQ